VTTQVGNLSGWEGSFTPDEIGAGA
jgi:hypothetical protein